MSLQATQPSTTSAAIPRDCSLRDMLVYAQGDCAISLVMNGIFGFAMLYYTNALGLNPAWAGIAMSLSVVWEAISEPLMGHISDITRSRWGRRHAYMLIGGLLMAACSYFIWDVPQRLLGSQVSMFWYLVTMNLLLRSGLTMFFIPYVALGFEMSNDYQGRSRMQAIRQIFNMAANFAGPAMAWTIFFQNHGKIQATSVAANYLRMGTVFALATALFVLVVVAFTYRWHKDTRFTIPECNSGGVSGFFLDIKQVLLDPVPKWVFVFVFLICVGMVLVSSLQMFVYVDFMNFSADQKTIAQGGTMIGMALGALFAIPLAHRVDKKAAATIGGLISICANILLAIVFSTGLVKPTLPWHVAGINIPAPLIILVLGQAGYWFGNGIMLPLSVAMMADVSEIHCLKTGIRKDGSYSSVYSLAMRIAIALSLFLSGYFLTIIGYKTAPHGMTPVQTPLTIWKLALMTFLSGAALASAAIVAIKFYPVTFQKMKELRVAASNKEDNCNVTNQEFVK
jgi:GPH family glycoside/pentoside/hexuronide:cation symporter